MTLKLNTSLDPGATLLGAASAADAAPRRARHERARIRTRPGTRVTLSMGGLLSRVDWGWRVACDAAPLGNRKRGAIMGRCAAIPCISWACTGKTERRELSTARMRRLVARRDAQSVIPPR